jgi:hypothetical protein
MSPRQPHSDTAEASLQPEFQIIPAWIIGRSMLNNLFILVCFKLKVPLTKGDLGGIHIYKHHSFWIFSMFLNLRITELKTLTPNPSPRGRGEQLP